MAKDNKAKAAEKKARVAAKQEKKAKQSEKKAKNNPKKRGLVDDDGDYDDAEDNVDLDAILADIAKKQELHLKVTETPSDPPPPRSSSTLVASPTDPREIFLFGGELYNGALTTFNNDLYVYRIPNDEWRKVTSPNSPLPRSGHAMCRGANNGLLYLSGGEFSSPRQSIFHHFHDFWQLDPASREWSRLDSKGQTPSARSGHRIVPHKRYIVLYGGFQDTSQHTKYLNDLWIYDCLTFTWHAPVLPPAAAKPEARSSFSFLPHDMGAVLFGGYARVKSSVAVQQHKKGGKQSTRVVMAPVVYQDAWLLRITPPASDAPLTTLPTVRWERRKRPANTPTPARAGATMVHHKGRGILFGGVHDVEASEEDIDSEFFNQLFGYSIDRNRFFNLSLRKARGPSKKQTNTVERARRARGKADEEDLMRNLALLEARGTLAGADDNDLEMTDIGALDAEDEENTSKVEKPVSYEFPHPRFNAHLATQNDVLYIYGGNFEKDDREYTFDQMYSVDLGKLDGVREIFRREAEDWQGSDDDSDDEDDEDDDDEDDEDEATEDVDQTSQLPDSSMSTAMDLDRLPSSPITTTTKNNREEEEPDSTAQQDNSRPHPRPFESLRQFFVRTSPAWQEAVLERIKYEPQTQQHKSTKELRATAFERAEAEWWDCREEIQALEDERDEAGIGDVVNFEGRAGDAGTAGGPRRR